MLLVSFGVMVLWNAVIPDIFGLKEIRWAQAFFLLVLSNLLLKSK